MAKLSKTRPSRRERELNRHRAEALDAAERLLAGRPYPSISVQQIAEEAEFSVGYLYKLFASKDDLYLALLDSRKNDVLLLVQKAHAETSDFSQGLTQLVTGIQSWLREHVGIARDNRSELMMLCHRRRRSVEAIAEKDAEMHRAVVALFQRGINEGTLGGADSDQMAQTLRALIWGFMSDDFHAEECVSAIDADHIIQIILRSYSPHWKEHD